MSNAGFVKLLISINYISAPEIRQARKQRVRLCSGSAVTQLLRRTDTLG